MSEIITTFFFTYKIAWVISFVLLFLRDDIDKIYLTLAMSFKENIYRGLFHVIVILIILPITLPFTLANILNRCM